VLPTYSTFRMIIKRHTVSGTAFGVNYSYQIMIGIIIVIILVMVALVCVACYRRRHLAFSAGDEVELDDQQQSNHNSINPEGNNSARQSIESAVDAENQSDEGSSESEEEEETLQRRSSNRHVQSGPIMTPPSNPATPTPQRRDSFPDKSLPPIPSSPNLQKVESKGSEFDTDCIICYEKKIDTLLAPCGHLVVCHDCALLLKDKQCPICRATINQIFKAYFR
jgi:hypothetical protein